ncbi:MAG: (d)CMP kinase [Oscillospiraceae bacterium]|nr:MAG: (d)CMP kinase [Oscillospiraceae bacterium]
MNHPISIAIDGPAAAGKSTVARRLAAELGFLYVDTGALYRAIGYAVLTAKQDPADAAAVEALLPSLQLSIRYVDGVQRIFLNGQDVSEEIRLPEMSMAASRVSAIPAVRAFLLDLQRDFARRESVVMDGRDIGTVVLPDAAVKFFLTASPEERAWRRMREFEQKGQTVDYGALLSEIKQRDYNDSHRPIAPLVQAPDALLVDNTHLTLEETVRTMKSYAEEKL